MKRRRKENKKKHKKNKEVHQKQSSKTKEEIIFQTWKK